MKFELPSPKMTEVRNDRSSNCSNFRRFELLSFELPSCYHFLIEPQYQYVVHFYTPNDCLTFCYNAIYRCSPGLKLTQNAENAKVCLQLTA